MLNHPSADPNCFFPRHDYCAGEQISCPPQVVFLCASGVVLLSTTLTEGEEGFLGLVTPGLAFGRPLSQAQTYAATPLTAVSVHRLNLQEVQKSPAQTLQMLPYVLRSLRLSQELLVVAGQRSIEERLDAFLTLLGRQAGQRTEQGVLLDFRLTHRQIANAICATRVSVTRLISRYREQGLLAHSNQRLLLRCCDKFAPTRPTAWEAKATPGLVSVRC